MNYLSVCSGIEAASAAWHDLKWNPVGFSEIERFPSQVLAHHYPNVPNLGDMTKYKEWEIDPIRLLVGGTPCQSFSVAGLRKGLEDPRGNLALTYVGILDKFRPKWFIWENVQGVLSSGGGRDFGAFLGAVAELGYGFAYRVLDAQYFGVPQRRRRVFVVGCSSGWELASKVLFESESLRRDTPPSRETREEPSSFFESSLAQYRQAPVGGTLKASGGVLGGGSETFLTEVFETHPADSRVKPMGEVCQTVTSRWGTGGGNVPIALQDVSGRDKSQNGKGWNDEGISYTVDATATQGVAQPIVLMDQGGSVINTSQDGIVGTLRRETHGHEPSIVQNMAVRRLTPIECERLQGFPDDYTNIPNAADTNRYKALGNSMAVPVMKWIGKRIDALEKLEGEK
jgi:DNA (cytosine-5)-methyltransferase 1